MFTPEQSKRRAPTEGCRRAELRSLYADQRGSRWEHPLEAFARFRQNDATLLTAYVNNPACPGFTITVKSTCLTFAPQRQLYHIVVTVRQIAKRPAAMRKSSPERGLRRLSRGITNPVNCQNR